MKTNVDRFNCKTAAKVFVASFAIIKNIAPARLVAVLLITLILGVSPSLSILITQNVINTVQIPDTALTVVLFWCAMYIFVDVMAAMLNEAKSFIIFDLNYRVNIKVSKMIFDKTAEIELTDFEGTNLNDLLKRAQEQSSGAVFSYFLSCFSIVQAVVTVVTSGAIVMQNELNWILLIIIAVALIKTLISLRFSEYQYKIYRERTPKERKKWYYQYILTNDTAFKEVKLFGLRALFTEKFLSIFNEFFLKDKQIQKMLHIYDFLMRCVNAAVVGFAFVSIIIQAWSKKILIGNALGFISSLNNVKSNVEGLCGVAVDIVKNAYYVDQLFEYLRYSSKANFSVSQSEEPYHISKIEFRNVSFRYANKTEAAVKNISFTLEKGKIYSIIGRNGSGKSTVSKLIEGYYDNYEGEILINGVELRLLNIETYREHLSALLQDYVCYQLSVRENICIANTHLLENDERIKKLLQEIGVNENIGGNLDLPLGYWFDNGTQISGGEWIRLAISRALIRPSDLVILDEPNSSLDALSSQRVLTYFCNFIKKKIGVLIIHRVASAKDISDEFILMDNGILVDSGTHEELYSRSPLYKQLYDSSQK